MKRIRKRLLALSATGLFAASILFMPAAQAAAERDCDDNAIIRCGALTETELHQKCWENQAGVIAIFREFGIKNCDMLDGLEEGRVTGDNKVYVGNELVATDAFTAGRHNLPGSTPVASGIAFKRPPGVSFVDPNGSLRALVKRDGKVFRFGVITSCGNPVMATPVAPPIAPPTPPAAPTVQAAPTPPPAPPPVNQTQSQVQTQTVVIKEQPAPNPTLPVTGPANILGIFTATTIGGIGAHQLVGRLARRLRLR